jgi:hypothetical protein
LNVSSAVAAELNGPLVATAPAKVSLCPHPSARRSQGNTRQRFAMIP